LEIDDAGVMAVDEGQLLAIGGKTDVADGEIGLFGLGLIHADDFVLRPQFVYSSVWMRFFVATSYIFVFASPQFRSNLPFSLSCIYFSVWSSERMGMIDRGQLLRSAVLLEAQQHTNR
jgi:hypothetical protein